MAFSIDHIPWMHIIWSHTYVVKCLQVLPDPFSLWERSSISVYQFGHFHYYFSILQYISILLTCTAYFSSIPPFILNMRLNSGVVHTLHSRLWSITKRDSILYIISPVLLMEHMKLAYSLSRCRIANLHSTHPSLSSFSALEQTK